MKRFVVVYHKFCFDGFCSAAIAHLYFAQLNKYVDVPQKFHIDYFPVIAGHSEEAVDTLIQKYSKDVKVLSFDLSFSFPAAVKLLEYFPEAQIVDHHKTTYDECLAIPAEGVGSAEYEKAREMFSKRLHFDNDHSGAALAFKFFFNDEQIPTLVQYVEDRDLWAWKMPDSKSINAGLYRNLSMHYANEKDYREQSLISFLDENITFGAVEGKIPVFDNWVSWMVNDSWLEKVKNEGEIVNDVQRKAIRRLYKSGKSLTIDDKNVFTVNANSFISELGNTICEWTEEDGSPSYNYALIWRYDRPTDMCYVSLRSLQGTDNDVEVVAKNNGGGGHVNAAGFEIKLDVLFGVFNAGTWSVNKHT